MSDQPPEFLDDDNKIDDSMFVSVMSPTTADISLSGADDDDDEDPFGSLPIIPTATNIVAPVPDQEKDLFQPDNTPAPVVDDDDIELFESKTTPTENRSPVAEVVPEIPVTPIKKEKAMFTTDVDLNSTPSVVPVRSTVPLESQMSYSTPITKSVLSEIVTASQPVSKQSTEHDIKITVSDPTKVGDGMSSYMTYRLTTKTTLPTFKKPEFSVNRRFSDFLGLHTKIVHKYLHTGLMLPSPPEKDSISMAKVKISKDETIPTDFIDRRRALLERYLNRLVQHVKLVEDADIREFIEMPNDLPKSSNTQALSGAGVLRAFSTISNQVTKLTTKTSEQDQWFEEKHSFVLELQSHFKHLYTQFNVLFSHRKEAGSTLKHFSALLNHLATAEEQPLLSSALVELANLEEKLEQVNNESTVKEYSILAELVKEYIALLDMAQLAFHERIKSHQQWLNAEDTLKRKREAKVKLEQNPKGADKLPQAEMEINDWEGKVVRGKEEFERVSATIKQEMEVFEKTRIEDFQQAIDRHLKNVLEQQERILQIWEAFLPEADKITV